VSRSVPAIPRHNATTYSLEHLTHLILPLVTLGRLFGDENVIGSGAVQHGIAMPISYHLNPTRDPPPHSRNTCQQGQPTTMPSHDLDDERSRMRTRGGRDRVDGLANPVKGGQTTNGQIGHGHVVARSSEHSKPSAPPPTLLGQTPLNSPAPTHSIEPTNPTIFKCP